MRNAVTQRIAALVSAGILTMTSTAAAQSAPPDTASTRPALTLEVLAQRVMVLERLLELEREAAATRASTTPTFKVASDGATWIAPDQNFQLKLRGYLHQDSRYYTGENHAGLSTFTLRRVRPVIEATAFKKYSFRIMPDFGDGRVVLYDAYVDLAFAKPLQLRFGKFKPPVGLERLMSATAIPFAERALPTSLVPNRDLGIQLSGDLLAGGVNYAVGVFNGVDDGAAADGDINNDKELAARVMVQPFISSLGMLRGLGAGVAVTRGTQHGSLTSVGLAGYRSPGQNAFFSFRNDAKVTGTAIADGTRQRIMPQAFYYFGPLSALGEYVVSTSQVDFDQVSDKLEQRAWQVSAGYVLSGEDASARGVKPLSVFDPTQGQWGAVELVARAHGLKVDAAAFPIFADPARSAREAQAWAVGVNWYLNANVKLVVDYERTMFLGGAANNADRPTEQALFARVQFAF